MGETAPTREALEVQKAHALTASEFHERAFARIQGGREFEAREDLEAALAAQPDENLLAAIEIELAYLDLRERQDLLGALERARRLSETTEGSLRARALHVWGLAEGKRRNDAEAQRILLEALELYTNLQDRLGQAWVLDTLGSLYAARGRLDLAAQYYALSLVDKTLRHDLHGMGITLGNLGRLHLHAGRFEDARLCLERDLEIVAQLGDERGRGRVLEDLGRLHLQRGDLRAARENLEAALECARRHGFRDLAFFAHRDLVFLRLRENLVEAARKELEAAESTCPAGGEHYFQLLLDHARGEVRLAEEKTDEGIEFLRRAIAGFEEAHLPDLEIAARVSLTRALARLHRNDEAGRALAPALRITSRDGYQRLQSHLHDVMSELDIAASLQEEHGRFGRANRSAVEEAYSQIAFLGEGAFGRVYSAYDPLRRRMVALKILHLPQDAEERRRVLASARRELEAASRIVHENVARVHAVGMNDAGEVYVVQDLVAGRALTPSFRESTRFDPRAILEITRSIAHGLQALHEAGVIHRDLKPDNVLLTDHQGAIRPILVDFGIADLVGRPALFGEDAIVGTLTYQSPEQAAGKRGGPASDLYSLGVLLFEWLTGVAPVILLGNDVHEDLARIQNEPAASLAELRPDLPTGLNDLVKNLLAKKSRRRPQTAARVAEWLTRLLDR